MRKSVTSQTEKAFAAYIQASQSANSLATVSIYAGGLVDVPTTLTPPWLIFTASAPEQFNNDCGIYELKLTACLATQVDDEMDVVGQDVHRLRLEDLRDMLENVPLIQSFVNPPVSGSDSRTVQSFTLSGIVYEDDDTKESERKLITDISYYICASPSDSQ